MRSTRLRSSRSALLPIFLLVAALISWPMVDSLHRQTASAQSVSWLGPESTRYLTQSSGIPVWVPSWLPDPVAGISPEISAGGGSYSIYFHGGGNTFLYITGVAGAGFPGGSEANLNVELSVNTSVAGYPAIHDIGIPQGSDTQIYDKVMWIAGGVLYTVNSNGLSSGSHSLATSSVVLQAPAAPAPTSPPAPPPPASSGGNTSGGNNSGSGSGSTAPAQSTSGQTTGTSSDTSPDAGSQTSGQSNETGVFDESGGTSEFPEATGVADDGTGGPWYTGHGVSDLPSDGTAGPTPPRVFQGDGTGGAP